MAALGREKQRKYLARRAAQTRPCPVCGVPFVKGKLRWRMGCSPACRKKRKLMKNVERMCRMKVEQPEKWAKIVEQNRERRIQRMAADAAYRRQRKQNNRRRAQRDRELAQLRDFERLAAAVGDDERTTGP